MPTFMYTQYRKKNKYGFDVTVAVWELKQNVPSFVGKWEGTTGSYKGECGEACSVIQRAKRYKVKPNIPLYSPSDFVRKDVKLFKLDENYCNVYQER